jgi:hypothetical protein
VIDDEASHQQTDGHFWTYLAHHSPKAINGWCEQLRHTPSGQTLDQWRAYDAAFNAGCTAAVYDEAAKE